MRYRTTVLAVCAVLGSISQSSLADIKPNEQAASSTAEMKLAQRMASADGSKLRCWQYGKLLFEEGRVSGAELGKGRNSLLFSRKSADQGDLVLIEFGTATCLYEK